MGLRVGASGQRSDTDLLGQGPRAPEGFTALPYSAETHHAGYPDPSDSYRWGDQGTEWPLDRFTRLIVQDEEHPISRPAPHSYYGDDNMEAYRIVGPYCADNEATNDLGLFSGATGPTGHVTPQRHPELAAPQSPV
jgi:hypothetical protein